MAQQAELPERPEQPVRPKQPVRKVLPVWKERLEQWARWALTGR